MKKYEFTGDTMEFEGRILRRIRYLENKEPYITKNMLGGWIESEENLSHEGSCAVRGVAKVFGHAKVMDDALVIAHAIVKDNALVKDNCCISEYAIIGADTIVGDASTIEGQAQVFFYSNNNGMEEANITGKSIIDGDTSIEATGSIYHSRITSQNLTGDLNMENVILVKSVYHMNEYEPIMYGEN